jgi:hypothetical protein
MYPSVRVGNPGSARTQQALSSTVVVNPCFTSFCRWLGIIEEGAESYSTMTQGGRKGNTFEIPVLLPISFFTLSFSITLFFSRHMEEDKEKTVDGAQGYRGLQERPPASNPTMLVVKRLGPLRQSLPTSPTPRTSRQLHQQGIPKSYHEMRPSMGEGPAKYQGLKTKPARQVRAAQSEEQSDTKGGQQLARSMPYRGDPTSSSFVFES